MRCKEINLQRNRGTSESSLDMTELSEISLIEGERS